ncbi:6-phosphofructokinase [Salinifilum aidingensis]
MPTGMRVGVLTGGGDCPGLNAVLRAVTRRGVSEYGHEIVGFRNGWQGTLEGAVQPLGLDDVEHILDRGGTVLGSSRTNPYALDDGVARLQRTLERERVDALVAIGGEDTLGVAERLGREGVPVVGVPKTIDNDLAATDYTFGFDTAVHIATESIDRLRTTAESHHRALVVEVMGRHAGWIALHSGLAGGANVILVPEQPFSVPKVCDWVRMRFEREYAPIIVVAEGAVPEGGAELLATGERDAFGHVRLGGVGTWLADEIAEATGHESRAVVLGHTQRGGPPTAYDRVLATRFGLHAIEAVTAGEFGSMVALRGTDVVRVPLREATAALKTVPLERYAEAEVLFG